jgi:hypothetical protein
MTTPQTNFSKNQVVTTTKSADNLILRHEYVEINLSPFKYHVLTTAEMYIDRLRY